MIRFRDIRDGWNVPGEESGEMKWKRNEDPMLGLVPTDQRRCVVLYMCYTYICITILIPALRFLLMVGDFNHAGFRGVLIERFFTCGR